MDDAPTDDTAPRPQHLDALARANRIRLRHAELKRDLRDGRMTLKEVLYSDDASSMTILAVLMAQKRWGLAYSQRVLSRERIAETKRVDHLTERQRRAIIAACVRPVQS